VYWRCVTTDGVWRLNLSTTCINHSELQVITEPLPISAIRKSPQHPLSPFLACCVNSHSLATASSSGDSSASSEYPATDLLSTANSNREPSQISWTAVSRDTLNSTVSARLESSLYSLGRTQQKTPFPSLYLNVYSDSAVPAFKRDVSLFLIIIIIYKFHG
jgi:hypothetical protein